MPISLEPPLIKSYTLSPLLATPSLPSSINMCWSDVVKNIMKSIVGGVNCTWGIPFKGDIKNDGTIELFHIIPNEKIVRNDCTQFEILFYLFQVNINEKLISAGLLKVEEEEREIAGVTVEEEEEENEKEMVGITLEEEDETKISEMTLQECEEPTIPEITNKQHNNYIQTLKKVCNIIKEFTLISYTAVSSSS